MGTVKVSSDRQRIARETAKKWWEDNRDDFVTGFTGSGLATRSEYDVPAMLAAYALRALEQAEGWVKVETKLPENGQRVLLTINGIVQHISYLFTGEGWQWEEDGEEAPLNIPSHWRALPSPPKSEETANG